MAVSGRMANLVRGVVLVLCVALHVAISNCSIATGDEFQVLRSEDTSFGFS